VPLLRALKDRLIRGAYARHVRYLETADPAAIVAAGERALLAAFRRAAAEVPAYRDRLAERGVAAGEVRDLGTFRARVPILDKESVFKDGCPLRNLCAGGKLDGIATFHSSSGHSGTFSYGVETHTEARRAAVAIEFLLDVLFDLFRRRALLINCLPMGVKVHTRTVPVAETGVRSDVVLALVRVLADEFEQFILVGESLFLKKVIDEGADAGVPWHALLVHAVTGGEFIAEGYRCYLDHMLGSDSADGRRGMVALNMGLSELSLSIFRDSPDLVRIRRLAGEDPALRHALFGRDAAVCPEILQYDPRQTWLETASDEAGRLHLLVSVLDPCRKVPLIRYNTHDRVTLMGYRDLVEVLRASGHPSLAPRFHLPVGIIWGKDEGVVLPGGARLSPIHVKDALFCTVALARHITGLFHIARDPGGVILRVQAREGVTPVPEMAKTVEQHVRACAGEAVPVEVLPYGEFRHGCEFNYEKKPKYL
jgi:phenylacetate-CoA ligase